MGLLGLALGIAVNRPISRPAGDCFRLLLSARHRGGAPASGVRKMGVRTQREINREKYALKALRGDFEHVSPELPSDQEER
jgi:hypothetical protein